LEFVLGLAVLSPTAGDCQRRFEVIHCDSAPGISRIHEVSMAASESHDTKRHLLDSRSVSSSSQRRALMPFCRRIVADADAKEIVVETALTGLA